MNPALPHMALKNSPVCDFGWPAPDFTLATPTGERHSRDSLMDQSGRVVVFICNHCPYVLRIASDLSKQLNALQARHVGVAAIMANDYDAYPSDAPDKMVAFAATHGFDFPYLVDEDQSVARAYGAACTPDFFGFNADGTLQYRGNFAGLTDAMTQVATTGAGPRDQTASMGCSIKWR